MCVCVSVYISCVYAAKFILSARPTFDSKRKHLIHVNQISRHKQALGNLRNKVLFEQKWKWTKDRNWDRGTAAGTFDKVNKLNLAYCPEVRATCSGRREKECVIYKAFIY